MRRRAHPNRSTVLQQRATRVCCLFAVDVVVHVPVVPSSSPSSSSPSSEPSSKEHARMQIINHDSQTAGAASFGRHPALTDLVHALAACTACAHASAHITIFFCDRTEMDQCAQPSIAVAWPEMAAEARPPHCRITTPSLYYVPQHNRGVG